MDREFTGHYAANPYPYPSAGVRPSNTTTLIIKTSLAHKFRPTLYTGVASGCELLLTLLLLLLLLLLWGGGGVRGVAVMYRPFVVWMVAPVGGVSVVGEGERTCAGVPGSGHASTNPIRLQGQAVLFAQCCAAQACLISRPTGGHGHGRRVGRHGKVVAPAEHGKRDDGLKQRKLVADALALAAACWGGGMEMNCSSCCVALDSKSASSAP